MAGKGKRQVSYQTKKVESKAASEIPQQSLKKDKSVRHSYHPGGTSNYSLQGGFAPLVDGLHNSFNYVDRRSFVTRERSFIRPQSHHHHTARAAAAAMQTADSSDPHCMVPPELLQRQRSFVQPGLLHHHQQGHAVQQHHRKRNVMPAAAANHRGKPALEIYRPPTLRGPNIFENGNGEFLSNDKHDMSGFYASHNPSHTTSNSSRSSHHHNNYNRPGLNIHAKEFVSTGEGTALQHSKSSGNLHNPNRSNSLHHSKSGHSIRGTSTAGGAAAAGKTAGVAPSPPKVHFSDDKENEPAASSSPVKEGSMQLRPPSLAVGPLQGGHVVASPVKRSKSLGSADMRHATLPLGEHSSLTDIGPFAQEVHNTISKAINDPNALSARQMMEVARHLFTRVVESSKNAEPTARLCITIIENEKGETFLETLLNTCQEYFQERDRLLRNSPPGPYHSYVPSHPRWNAFMSFLNEMYTQLKRRHVQLMTRRMRNSETAPGLLLLTLLAQCCQICLREQAINSLAETECLFFVLTAVGKDIEVELPQQMGKVMGAARDAFLTTAHVPAVRKTLLQLIEMHAARWQLPASAVMYYYPGSSAAK